MLEGAPNFNFRNYSVPIYDPLINPETPVGKNELAEFLKGRLSR